MATRSRPDGVVINRWDGSGQCYCEHCRKNFRDASGLELPRTNNPQDPARRAYILWRQERLFALWRKWDDALRALNPDSCVIPNGGGGPTSSPGTTTIRPPSPPPPPHPPPPPPLNPPLAHPLPTQSIAP